MRQIMPLSLLLAAAAVLAGCATAAPAIVAVPAKPAAAPIVPSMPTPVIVVTPGQPAPTVEPDAGADEPPLPEAVLRMADGVVAESADGTGEVTTQPVKASLLTTWKTLISAARSGERTLMPGNLPPYPTLDADAMAAAAAKGQGRTLRLSAISSGPPTPHYSEPASFLVHADKAALVKAFKAAGWTPANSRSAWNYIKMGGSVVTRLWDEEGAPVSPMYLDGHIETMAFNKNSDFVLARDHFRAYDLGDGTFAIAASRDLAATVTFHHPTKAADSRWKLDWQAPSFGHHTDDVVDQERALVLKSLLDAQQLKDWAIVKGAPADGIPFTKVGDQLKVGHYLTDGNVYELWLK